jgi:hypothetical protein
LAWAGDEGRSSMKRNKSKSAMLINRLFAIVGIFYLIHYNPTSDDSIIFQLVYAGIIVLVFIVLVDIASEFFR